MEKIQKFWLVFLRVALGWLFFYAGITKIIDPKWSAGGYLKNAKLFQDIFGWLASPEVLPTVNLVNEWGLFLLGISLLLGAGVRLSAPLGAILMFLYYLPLGFPYPNAHSFIVDEHVVYIFALLVVWAMRSGRFWGLDGWLVRRWPIFKKISS